MLRVGLFGAGSCTQLHLDNWAKIDGIIISGFYDPSDGMSRMVAKKYGIPGFDNPAELIRNCDIADIASDISRRFEFCKDAILKSRHVFVQTPMASSMAEADEVLKLVREANVRFQVDHPKRFNPAYIVALKHIRQPEFIEMQRVIPFNSAHNKDDLVSDLMIHDIDLVLSIIKSNVRTVRANGVNILRGIPEVVSARIQFDNGSVANLTISGIGMNDVEKMEVFQKNTHIEINLKDRETRIESFEYNGAKSCPVGTNSANNHKDIKILIPEVKDSNTTKEALKSFISSIRNNTSTQVNEWAGYRSLQVAHQIIDQIKKHKFV